MNYCKYYIGVACVSGQCPVAVAEEDGYNIKMRCDECFYYRGCEDCATPYYEDCLTNCIYNNKEVVRNDDERIL